MDCICLKRKHRKRRDADKFRPITPQTSPTHSQPSTLGNDGRLPKVNSTGLWIGAPSMYTGAAPSPAYYYGPGKTSPHQIPPHPGFISRANSESRIPAGVVPVSGIQPRIFHSSQPLAPVFEVPPSGSGLEIYDVYQFGGDSSHSRSKLVEEKHSKSYYDQAMNAYRIARSQSDVQERQKQSGFQRSRNSPKTNSKPVSRTSSGKSNKPPPPPNHRRTGSRESPANFGSVYSGSRKSQSIDSLDGVSRSSVGGQYNQAFDDGLGFVSSSSRDIILMPALPHSKITIVPAEPILNVSHRSLPNGNTPTSNEIHPLDASATDSMKILAKNKTDDQKTVVVSSTGLKSPPSSNEEKDTEKFPVDDLDLSKGHVHYIYQGDIYALPGKQPSIKNKNHENEENDDNNPILSRLKNMVIEKSRSNSTKSVTAINNQNIEDTRERDSESLTPSFSYGIEEIYQEIANEEQISDNSQTPSPDSGNISAENKTNAMSGTVTTSSYSNTPDTLDNATENNLSIPTSVQLRPNGSVLGDTSFEDISKAGKRITDSAFEFLNTYLSDDDGNETGADIESPPLSPL